MISPPPRILCLTADQFPPFRVDVKVLLGDKLAKRGYRIDWILQSSVPCPSTYSCEYGGGTAHVCPTNLGTTRFARVRKHWIAVRHHWRVFALHRRERYDIVQVKDKYLGALFGLLACWLYGGQFVFWLSFPFPEESIAGARAGTARYPLIYLLRGHLLAFLQYRIIMRFAKHIVVQSEKMKSDVAGQGVLASKLYPVPMGIRLEDFKELRDGINLQPGAPRNLLYLGAIDLQRHIDFLVRVLALVKDRHPDVVLYIVGGSNDRRARELIEEEARRLGLEQSVILTGQIDRAQALKFVSQADVCLSPYYPSFILNSTSPTKLIEYMAMRKAVIANDHPEQQLVIRESGGGLCVPYDEQSFAEAADRLLSDSGLARKMGELGFQYVTRHRDYGVIAGQLDQYYRNVIAS